MQRDEFSYSLPTELIAQFPSSERGASRLLCLDTAEECLADRQFAEFAELLSVDDLLVFNDTRVLPARLYGHKTTGGRVEIMVERVLDAHSFLAQMRYSKIPQPGSRIVLGEDVTLEVKDRNGDMFTLEAPGELTVLTIIEELGHVPLPPYIKRGDAIVDRERYQTVYARQPGAVAAPTAGLHFTRAMLRAITDRGIRTGFLTLHVGAGTFQPLRTRTIEEHRMHSELLYVSAELCAEVEAARKRGGRVVTVGTTAVRGLETAGRTGSVQPFAGDTDIFIYPGFDFKIVDALLTNFHLPESTLLMLVCAFAGKERVMRAYEHAIAQKYRFYSYGDAMFITS
ncbi:MAG: tRNA preQ1(34) S-adenosylmethionine ribosyltransferase-isomerase QueA [Gammaproteobacteria bacterium]